MRTIEQIKAVMLKKGHKFFGGGDYNLNLIAVRENDTFENTFSDTLYCIYKKAGTWQMLTLNWTTLAGTLGIGGEKNPLTGAQTGTGVDGVAVIAEGQYLGAYQFLDTYRGFLSYPYFTQIKNISYYRDNDKNGIITRGKLYVGNYGTFLHRMSNNGVVSGYVNFDWASWSQGCNGAPEPEFRKLVDVARQAVIFWGDKFSYSVIHANDF